jgi:acyl carrier protein
MIVVTFALMDEIERQIRDFLSGAFGHRGVTTELSGEERLLFGGILDSTALLDVVAFLEEEQGVEVADHEIAPDNFGSIVQLVGYVRRKKGIDDSSGSDLPP